MKNTTVFLPKAVVRLSNFADRGLPHAYNSSEQMRQDLQVLFSLFIEALPLKLQFRIQALQLFARGELLSQNCYLGSPELHADLAELFHNLRQPPWLITLAQAA